MKGTNPWSKKNCDIPQILARLVR